VDQQEIKDWVDFCEGKRVFDRDHFSGIFIELFAQPLTQDEIDGLHTVFKYVPHSRQTLHKLMRMNDRAEDKTAEEIVDIVRRDLHEKARVVDSQVLIDAINCHTIALTVDEERFEKARTGKLNAHFSHCLANLFIQHLSRCDEKIRVLWNAFYGLANNLHLQFALTANLLGCDVSFDNYFELYLIGVDYALGDDCIIVMNYRARIPQVVAKQKHLEDEGYAGLQGVSPPKDEALSERADEGSRDEETHSVTREKTAGNEEAL